MATADIATTEVSPTIDPATTEVSPGADRTRDLFEFFLRLGDNDLILAQRLCEWVGHGPVLEEELALANVGLDLLGQARLWLGRAGEIEAHITGTARSDDELAFLRDANEFRNLLLVEQPNGNYADTIARQFFFDSWHHLTLTALSASGEESVADIASKAAKEVAYHVERSADWMVRLGDGTATSHARMQAAIDRLWMYTGEMFAADEIDRALAEAGIGCDVATLVEPWRAGVAAVLDEATLTLPPASAYMQGVKTRGGKHGVHTEHLGHLLATMQSLARAHPNAQW